MTDYGDAWLERELADAQMKVEAWEWYVTMRNRPPIEVSEARLVLGRDSQFSHWAVVDGAALDVSHPDHAIYEAWEMLEAAIEARYERLQDEEEL